MGHEGLPEARLLFTCLLLATGVGLPGVYPGGVLPGTGENKEGKGALGQGEQSLAASGMAPHSSPS